MAFTFQVNTDKFIHDEKLLAKAESYRPVIHHATIKPVRLLDAEREISRLGEYCLKRDDRIVLDFGRHIVGKFSVDIAKVGSPQDAPLFMRIKFAEMPAELQAESSDYEGWLSRSWIQEEFIHLDELPVRLELPRRYSFRYVEIKIIDTSPKWQAVFTNPEAVSESSANYTKLHKPVIHDEVLSRIYDAGVTTLAECMQDVFEDGPKRDRRLWLGDLRLQALANYVAFDNTDLVKRCLYLFAGMTTEEGKISANVFTRPENIPDDTFLYEYSLFFISTLYDLNKAHPDAELVRELYPTCRRQMDLTLKMIDAEGRLITDENYPVFVDWSNDFAKDTAGQAETIYVLRQFIALAEIAGEKDIDNYRSVLGRMEKYSREKLYNASRKLFVAGEGEYNIASQVWMVLAHVMSDDENREILRTMIRELFPVRGIATPYMYHCIVEALFEGGLKDEAVKLMKDYWGKMLELGADTFWEAFDPDKPEYSPYGSPIVNSYCHAWSCTPVYLISKYLL
ncbi:MAG: hypothetical protein IJS28_12295 [Synergistaceae bacterium]|nr:hypothetical protein [Synergistaceae bacterium]